MSVLLAPAAQVMLGIDGVPSWLAGRPHRHVVVIVDAALADSAVARDVAAALRWAGVEQITTVPTTAPTGLSAIDELAAQLSGADLVVSLGGGATLDAAKVALVTAVDPTVLRVVTASGRTGFVHLPPPNRPPLPHIAIPTTLGTGSERGPRAILIADDRRRLLVGAALQPALAVLDAAASRTLPRALVMEGAMENLLRGAGAYVGDATERPSGIEDDLMRRALHSTVVLGHRLRASDPRSPSDDELRLEMAKISAWTQTPEMSDHRRDPFANKGWYLANELSTECSVRKVTAFAAIVPAWWSRILDGDTRWGSARLLRALWADIAAAGDLPDDPVAGFMALSVAWAIEPMSPIGDDVAARAAQRCCRAWGRGLPALGRLALDDIDALFRDAVVRPVI